MHRSLIALVALAAACSTGPNDQMEELRRAREQWAAQGARTYAFTVRRLCFCAGPVRVEVRVGEVAVVRTDLDTGLPVPAEFAAHFPDVAGLFAMIRHEIERRAAVLRVEYDSARGFPTSISVDPIKHAIDDEYGYVITGFAVP